MPHRCMECKSILESGELDLDTGCPVCGNKKFQYIRPQKKETKEADLRKLTVSEYVSHAGAVEPGEKHKHKEAPKHNPEPKAAPAAKEKKHEQKHEPRIDSVHIVEKGSYDLNLPMLLSRKELVMSREEGVYVVDLPSALRTTPKKKKR